MIFGDSPKKILEEEARLFYVALTRAKRDLYIVTDAGKTSVFLERIQKKMSLPPIDWDDFPPVCVDSEHLTVRVLNQRDAGIHPTMNIKGKLKSAGFRYQNNSFPCWEKMYPKRGFLAERLFNQDWCRSGTGIEVQVIDERDQILKRFYVDATGIRKE